MSRIFLSPPHMGQGELPLLTEAFESNWITPLGPHVDAFEREVAARVGVAHAVALSSGTAGLHLALEVVGVRSGDEVLVSTLTVSASANPITYVGARPVFIDCDRTSWNIDPALVAEELEACDRRGKLPAAVIAVDLYGQCADFAEIRTACERYEIPLIEDAAESLGATYRGKSAGSLGALGVLSFNGNKIITTSGGGMLVSDRSMWIERARLLASQARDPAPHYQHSEIGFNYRLSNLLAAVGRGQLQVLDERLAQRRANNEFYRDALALPGLEFMPEASYGRSNCWLTCLTVDTETFGATPQAIRTHLETLDIESRPVWKPMHLQPVFRDCRARGGAVAEDLFARGLCLPSGSSLTDDDRARVANAIRAMASAGG